MLEFSTSSNSRTSPLILSQNVMDCQYDLDFPIDPKQSVGLLVGIGERVYRFGEWAEMTVFNGENL